MTYDDLTFKSKEKTLELLGSLKVTPDHTYELACAVDLLCSYLEAIGHTDVADAAKRLNPD